MSGFDLWPSGASHHAHQVDLLIAAFGAMVWMLALPVFVLMGIFTWRYRHGRNVNRAHSPDGNVWFEASWSAVPFVLMLGFYVVATRLFMDLQHPPGDALTINVVAKQWIWKFQHPEGAREINDLHIPVGTPVKLVMTSQDVIHSLYLPALRIKQDVLPGRYTSEWFQADRTGSFPLRCTQFCGTDHSVMGGSLIVMTRKAYADWLVHEGVAQGGGSSVARGAALYRKSGCAACHERNQGHLAPPLTSLFGADVMLNDRTHIQVDEQYLRDALVLPNKQIVAGYRPIMPSYAEALDEGQIADLIAYLKSDRSGI